MENDVVEMYAEQMGLIACVFGGYVSCERCDGNCPEMQEFYKYMEIEEIDNQVKMLSLFDITKNDLGES